MKPNTRTNFSVAMPAVGNGSNDAVALGVPNAFMTVGGSLMFQAWESAPGLFSH